MVILSQYTIIRVIQTNIMTNYEALLTLIGDINNSFAHVEDENSANICDGDMKLLDKAVKRFKTQVWENQLSIEDDNNPVRSLNFR